MGLNIASELINKKLKLVYQPAAMVEQFRLIDFKEFNREVLNMVYRKLAWLQTKSSKRFQFQLQLFGKHEMSIPFWCSVDISWGDFHWMHLFVIWALWKSYSLGFLNHFSATFWVADEVLFIWCIFGFFLFKYFLPVLKIQPWSNFILWCWIRYRTNMSMFLGGLLASFKFKCFYWAESW